MKFFKRKRKCVDFTTVNASLDDETIKALDTGKTFRGRKILLSCMPNDRKGDEILLGCRLAKFLEDTKLHTYDIQSKRKEVYHVSSTGDAESDSRQLE